MANNELCSTFVTGKCTDKEIRAVCGRFMIEVVLSEPYMIFDISDDCEIDNGSGSWYPESAGKHVTVDANDGTIGTDKTYTMKIRSDSEIEYIKFISDTFIEINIISGDDLNTANQMCYNLETLQRFNLSGFNQIVDFTSMFENCFNLTYVNNFFVIPEDEIGDLTNIMPRMFRYCKSMAYVPNLDFSLTTDMDYAFSHMHNITEINSITVGQNFTANSMFAGCEKLNKQPIINYENITSSKEMFRYCPKITSFRDMDLSNSIDTYGLFWSCHTLLTVYGLKLGASNVDRMFMNCYELKCIDEIDTTSSLDLSPNIEMFSATIKLLTPSPSYVDLIKGGFAFQNEAYCPPIQSDKDLILNVYYDNGCRDLSFIADTDMIVDWGNSYACQETTVAVIVPGDEYVTYNPITCSSGTDEFASIEYGYHTYAYKAGDLVKYEAKDTLIDGVVKIHTYNPTTEFPNGTTTFKIGENDSVTKIDVMRANSLTNLDEFAMNNKRLENVTFPADYNLAISSVSAFKGCYSMTDNNLVTSNITDASNMFEDCLLFVVGDFTFNNTSLITMNGTFKNCNPIRFFFEATTILIGIDEAFMGCNSLQCINHIDTTGLPVEATDTFTGCSVLEAPRFSEQDAIMAIGGNEWTNVSGCPIDALNRDFEINFVTGEIHQLVITLSDDFGIDSGDGVHTQYRGGTSAAIKYNGDATENFPIKVFSYGSVQSFAVIDGIEIRQAEVTIAKSLTDVTNAFNYCIKMDKCIFYNTSNLLITKGLFSTCYTLKDYFIDTTYVTDMSNMFSSCRHNLGIDGEPIYVNVTHAENIDHLFNWCDHVSHVIFVITDDIPQGTGITSAKYAFNYAQSLHTLENFHSEQVTDFTSTFSYTRLTELGPWITFDAGIAFKQMMKGCSEFTCMKSIDTSNSTDNADMFDDCISLIYPPTETLDLISPDFGIAGYNWVNNNTGCVPPDGSKTMAIICHIAVGDTVNINTGMTSRIIWAGAGANGTDITHVVSSNITYNGPALSDYFHLETYEQVVSVSLEGSEITDAYFSVTPNSTNGFTSGKGMFKNCKKLEWFESDTYDDLITTEEMFMGCPELTYTYIKNPYNLNSVNMYKGCVKLSNLYEPFTTNVLENAYGTFEGCTLLRYLTVEDSSYHPIVDLSLTDTRRMFYGCATLPNMDFNTDGVLFFDGMFEQSGLVSSVIGTPSGTTFANMYRNSINLECVSKIDTRNAVAQSALTGIFDGCSSLSNPYGAEITDITTMPGIEYINTTPCPKPRFSVHVVVSGTERFTTGSETLDKKMKAYDYDTGAVYDVYYSMSYRGFSANNSGGNVVYWTDEVVTFFRIADVPSDYMWLYNADFTVAKDLQRIHNIGKYSLTSVKIFKEEGDAKLTDISNMCNGAPDLIEVLGFNDLSEVTTMSGTFNGCELLERFDGADTIKCKSFSSTFNGCTSLLSIGEINTTSSGAVTTNMFNGCVALTSPDAGEQTTILAGSHWLE